MKIDINEINKIIRFLAVAPHDPLKNFIAPAERERLRSMQDVNLNNLFQQARKFEVRFLYVGKGEICGCEDKRCGSWPAMWQLAADLGVHDSCGNPDQYQTGDAGFYFPANSYGGWDLVENRKLNDEETEKRKFNRVLTRTIAGKPW